jgi:hypothetical protein
MKEKLYLHVSKPCHENWEEMLPAQQGKFCESCSKQVVDFTAMTDQQILQFLSKPSGNTCGRFLNDQLERPIVKESVPVVQPKRFFLSAFIPAFLLAQPDAVKAQVKEKQGVAILSENTMGKATALVKKEAITGQIVDENGEPVAGVTVMIKGTTTGTVSDAKGEFATSFPINSQEVDLEVSFVGYKTKTVAVSNDTSLPIQITLGVSDQLVMGDVVVVGGFSYDDREPSVSAIPKVELKGKIIDENGEPIPFATVKLNTRKAVVCDSNGNFKMFVRANKKRVILTASRAGYETNNYSPDLVNGSPKTISIRLTKAKTDIETMFDKCMATALSGKLGGFSIVKPVVISDTLSTFIQKVFRNEMFKAFPNPAAKGSSINIAFKTAGGYIVQIFDNCGKLYGVKEYDNVRSKQVEQLSIPSPLANGTYFIKAVNKTSQKQFVDKLFIQ